MAFRSWFRECFDLLIPPSCGLCDRPLGPASGEVICDSCRAAVTLFPSPRNLVAEGPLDGLWALGPYEGLLKEGVIRLKFHQRRRLARLVGELGPPGLFDGRRYDAIVPVPLHPRRARGRGYNQAALLAVEVGKRLGIPVAPWALQRWRPTPPQSGLEQSERRKNIRGVFAPGTGCGDKLGDKSILLVDDVTTTGATLAECARVLKKAGAALVDGFVLARTL